MGFFGNWAAFTVMHTTTLLIFHWLYPSGMTDKGIVVGGYVMGGVNAVVIAIHDYTNDTSTSF